jgi:hypothetical protein
MGLVPKVIFHKIDGTSVNSIDADVVYDVTTELVLNPGERITVVVDGKRDAEFMTNGEKCIDTDGRDLDAMTYDTDYFVESYETCQ